MQPFDYLEPEQLSEAASTLIEYGDDARLLAGGTDLLVMIKSGKVQPRMVVNLKRIPGLSHITAVNGGLKLGALTSVRTIETSALVRKRFPILAEAAGFLGSLQIRNLATVGGNICRAAPCAETVPPLMALGARVCLFSPQGERTLPLEDFFTGPGSTILNPGEILTEIHIPTPPPASGGAYLRHSIRPLMALAIVNVAVFVVLDPERPSFVDAKVILGSVAPTVIHSPGAEAALRGQAVTEAVIEQAADLAAEDSLPITDVRAMEAYRRAMVRVFTCRAIKQAVARVDPKVVWS